MGDGPGALRVRWVRGFCFWQRRRVLCGVRVSREDSPSAWPLCSLARYRAGDELHLLHVIPRLQLSPHYGAPAMDVLASHDPATYEELISKAEAFLVTRALRHIGEVSPPPVVHLIKYELDTDSIGNAICKKALDIDASFVVVARHSKSKLQELFLGSVTTFCISNCAVPVVVHT